MHSIRHKCIIPSAAYTIPHPRIRFHCALDKAPEAGDLVFGEVSGLGQHKFLENVSSRLMP